VIPPQAYSLKPSEIASEVAALPSNSGYQRRYAEESFRGQSVVKEELVLSTMEEVSDLYTPAADTHLLHSLPVGAVYFW